MKRTFWHNDATPVENTLDRVMYEIKFDDIEGLLLDSVSLADIIEDSDGLMAFDALITPYARLPARMDVIKRVMIRAGTTVQPLNVQTSEPFMQNGTANVAAIFELSDGQTISIFFHNPDTTPKKILPTDELISWKWLLNKKDITIVVAPEKGLDLNPRQVAVRIMKLAEKNSASFIRSNGKRAERMQALEDLKTEITGLEMDLKGALHRLEVAKVEKEDRDMAVVEPVIEPEVIEQSVLQALIDDFGWENQSTTGGNLFWVTKTIGGGYEGGEVNPNGDRRLSAKIQGKELVAMHGDSALVTVPFNADEAAVENAKRLDDAVNAIDPRKALDPIVEPEVIEPIADPIIEPVVEGDQEILNGFSVKETIDELNRDYSTDNDVWNADPREIISLSTKIYEQLCLALISANYHSESLLIQAKRNGNNAIIEMAEQVNNNEPDSSSKRLAILYALGGADGIKEGYEKVAHFERNNEQEHADELRKYLGILTNNEATDPELTATEEETNDQASSITEESAKAAFSRYEDALSKVQKGSNSKAKGKELTIAKKEYEAARIALQPIGEWMLAQANKTLSDVSQALTLPDGYSKTQHSSSKFVAGSIITANLVSLSIRKDGAETGDANQFLIDVGVAVDRPNVGIHFTKGSRFAFKGEDIKVFGNSRVLTTATYEELTQAINTSLQPAIDKVVDSLNSIHSETNEQTNEQTEVETETEAAGTEGDLNPDDAPMYFITHQSGEDIDARYDVTVEFNEKRYSVIRGVSHDSAIDSMHKDAIKKGYKMYLLSRFPEDTLYIGGVAQASKKEKIIVAEKKPDVQQHIDTLEYIAGGEWDYVDLTELLDEIDKAASALIDAGLGDEYDDLIGKAAEKYAALDLLKYGN